MSGFSRTVGRWLEPLSGQITEAIGKSSLLLGGLGALGGWSKLTRHRRPVAIDTSSANHGMVLSLHVLTQTNRLRTSDVTEGDDHQPGD